MQSQNFGALACTVIIAAFGIAGCGKTKDEQAKKPSTQVVAKVDSAEISVHQLNAVLSKATGLTKENVGQAKWEVLGKLVEQQLAVNKAVERQLDRKPEVLSAIEAAKREILARAYLQELAAAQTKPTSDEVRNYYNEHPELFAQRRIYRIQEISLPKLEDQLPALRDKVASAKSLEDVAAWLKARGIPFRAGGGVRPAEQLPMEILPKVHAMKDGQIALLQSNEGMIIVRISGSETQPVNETQASPRITTFLSNQRSAEAIQREMKALKEKAKIEYLGEFAGGVPPKPAEPAPPPPKPVAPPKRAEPPAPKPTSQAPADSKLIEKGVSGLK